MAVVQIKVTTGPVDPYGVPTYAQAARPASASAASGTLAGHVTSMTADAIPVAAALAVLMADGASPTQAHVNTLNSAYGTLATDMANVATDQAAVAAAVVGNLVVQFDTSVIATQRLLAAALQKVLFDVKASATLPE